jgi:hypothetical protein
MTVTLMGSFLVILGHVIQLTLSDCNRCWYSVWPLVFNGIGYTTYSVVLWGSLPYMVQPHTLGTAFGICASF